MHTKYTKIETHVPIIPHTVRANLTPALSKDILLICYANVAVG